MHGHPHGFRTWINPRRGAWGGRGFTLVEFLLVLAVLAIFASMLTPVLQHSRESARLSACMTNLKVMGMAISVYGTEEGAYPPAYAESGETFDFILHRRLASLAEVVEHQPREGGQSLRRMRQLGIPSSPAGQVVSCPSRTIRTNVDPLWNYGLHPLLFVDRSDSSAPPLRKFGMVSRPGEVILAMDGTQDSYGYSFMTLVNVPGITNAGVRARANRLVSTGPDQDGDAFIGQPRYRHDGLSTALFVDGHVETFHKGELKERNFKLSY